LINLKPKLLLDYQNVIVGLTGVKLLDERQCSLCLSEFISGLACSYLGYTMASRATAGNMIAEVSNKLLSLA